MTFLYLHHAYPNLRCADIAADRFQKSKLKVCQRAMERSIPDFKQFKHIVRVHNTMHCSITGIADMGYNMARLKWDWASTRRRHSSGAQGWKVTARTAEKALDDLDAFEK